MRVYLWKTDEDAHVKAREFAAKSGCNLRAPHWSVSTQALLGELAAAAGGVLLLDEIGEFRFAALQAMRNQLALMQESHRPTLFVTYKGAYPADMRDPVRRMLQELANELPSNEEPEPGAAVSEPGLTEEEKRPYLEAARQKVLDAGIDCDDVDFDDGCEVSRRAERADGGTWVQLWIYVGKDELE